MRSSPEGGDWGLRDGVAARKDAAPVLRVVGQDGSSGGWCCWWVAENSAGVWSRKDGMM